MHLIFKKENNNSPGAEKGESTHTLLTNHKKINFIYDLQSTISSRNDRSEKSGKLSGKIITGVCVYELHTLLHTLL